MNESRHEVPLQADTSENPDLLNEDPLGGLEKESGPDPLRGAKEESGRTQQSEPVVPKTENEMSLKKWSASFTDTESDLTSGERKKSLRSSKLRQASNEGEDIKPFSPGRSRSSRTLRRRAAPIVIDMTESESEPEIKPRRMPRKVYSLRSENKVGSGSSAEPEQALSVGQRVSRRRRGTDSEGTHTEEDRVAGDGQTDSDLELSPRRRSRNTKSMAQLLTSSDDEGDDSAEKVEVEGEVRRQQGEQQRGDSGLQLPAAVVEGNPPTLEAGGGGGRPEPVDVGEDNISVSGTKDGKKPKRKVCVGMGSTVEPPYWGHLGDLSCIERCPLFRGVL